MPKKKLTIIFVIIVALLGILFLSRQEVTGDGKRADLDLSKNITPETINRITISGGETPVFLMKEGEEWTAGTRKVEPELLTRIWDTFAEVSFTGPVSKNPDNHERFEVTPETGVSVTFFQGETEQASILIGKTGKTFEATYMRLADQDEVYESSKNLAILFPIDEQNWHDKTIVALDTAQITEIHYTSLDDTFALKKLIDDEWVMAQGDIEKKIDTAHADAALQPLTRLTGLRFLSEPNIEVFDTTTDKTVLEVFSNDERLAHLELHIKESETWVHSSETGEYFAIAAFTSGQLLPNSSSF